jgi:hypothetical protein
MPDSQLRAPFFIEPANILEMTKEQKEELLEGIRNRRLLAVTEYLRAKGEAEAKKAGHTRAQLEKKATQLSDQIAKVDKAFEKIELLVRALDILVESE